MTDNAAVLLLNPRQKSGHIDKSAQGNIKCIAESNEAGHLVGGIDVERPREHAGLIGDDPRRAPLDAPETDHRILGKPELDFEEVLMVQQTFEHSTDVVGNFRFCRQQVIERRIVFQVQAVCQPRRVLEIVGGREAQKTAGQGLAVLNIR